MNRRVNLLPFENRRRGEHRSQAKRWGIAASTATLAIIAAQLSLEAARQQAADRLTLAESHAAPLRLVETGARRQQQQKNDIVAKIETCHQLEQTNVPLALLQVVSDSCRATQGEVRIESYRMDEVLEAGSQPAVRKQVTLAGLANSDARVTRFVEHLRSTGVFAQVELEASQAQSEDRAAQRSFRVVCKQ